MERREFLKFTAVAAGAVVVGVPLVAEAAGKYQHVVSLDIYNMYMTNMDRLGSDISSPTYITDADGDTVLGNYDTGELIMEFSADGMQYFIYDARDSLYSVRAHEPPSKSIAMYELKSPWDLDSKVLTYKHRMAGAHIVDITPTPGLRDLRMELKRIAYTLRKARAVKLAGIYDARQYQIKGIINSRHTMHALPDRFNY